MRRGHGSIKVPNVKLRPAPEKTRPSRSSKKDKAQPAQVLSDGPEEDYSDAHAVPHPFKGVVICATGVEDKMNLFSKARKLGAQTMPDFTDRVTHLLASACGSAKYNCAVERRIPVMAPSWVIESFDIWLKGDDVDLEESVRTHRLPIFQDVVLAISGIDDSSERRTSIEDAINENGGSYVKEIQRPVKVTHLICATDEETERIQYAHKFNKKGEARIQILWEEWFMDSLSHGGRFAEDAYKISRPRPKPRVIAPLEIPLSTPSSSAPSERAPLPRSIPTSTLLAPDDPDEPAPVKRIPTETLYMWESLLKPRGFAVIDGKLKRSPTKSGGPRAAMPPSSPTALPGLSLQEASGSTSSLSSFKRSKSFAPKDNLALASERTRQPFRRVASVMAFDGPSHNAGPGPSAVARGATGSSRGPERDAIEEDVANIFSGCRFRALGEANSATVRSTVESRGGAMIAEADEDVDFILVRLVSGSKYFQEEGDEAERSKYRTECWLEACIHLDEICSPSKHISFVPLAVTIPIPGAEHVHLSLSGLDSDDLCWVQRLVRAFGLNLLPVFTKTATHLICPSGTGAKYDRAIEWGVLVVSMGWLEAMANTGCLPPGTDHLVGAMSAPDVKGKGKARDTQMIDITDKTNNSHSSESTGASSSTDARSSSLAGRPMSVVQIQRAATAPTLETASMAPRSSFGQPSLLTSPSLPASAFTASAGSIMEGKARGESTLPRLVGKELVRDMTQTRIPSSESPSPLKAPPAAPTTARFGGSGSEGGSGPSLVESSKILQDQFTTLLRKRSSDEQDDGSTKGRGSKRPRPVPRYGTRQKSVLSPKSSLPTNFARESFSPFDTSVVVGEDRVREENAEGTDAEEGVRVMYEDPEQRDEKKRLLQLVGEDEGGQSGSRSTEEKTSKTKKLARRSTRMSGF